MSFTASFPGVFIFSTQVQSWEVKKKKKKKGKKFYSYKVYEWPSKFQRSNFNINLVAKTPHKNKWKSQWNLKMRMA